MGSDGAKTPQNPCECWHSLPLFRKFCFTTGTSGVCCVQTRLRVVHAAVASLDGAAAVYEAGLSSAYETWEHY